MDDTLLTLTLNSLLPTVNHMYMNARRRRFRTAECREYQDTVTAMLKAVWQDRPPFTGRAAVSVIFATNNKRCWDIDNRVKSIQDCLIMAGVIKDDSQIDFMQIERRYEKDISTRLILKSIKD